MIDVTKICPCCMKEKGETNFCPHCGYNINTEISPHRLRPGTILNGKYWLGVAIGEGGFGITYVGYDLNLELKVAIKEYFPNGLVTRDSSGTDTVNVYSGDEGALYIQGRDKFVNEAKALAKFDSEPGIVTVKDFFLENGTAYIVMEYIEGSTLKQFLESNGGRVPVDMALRMITPIMDSLAKVHSQGIIHRDISPDNIMMTKDYKMKLIDFGAARGMSPEGGKSLSIQLKPGFAPEEQYRTHGKQGPWTDVYALSATLYRMITGNTPIEALERSRMDVLKKPSMLGIQIHPEIEMALMTGLAVEARNRFANMEYLRRALHLDESVYRGEYTVTIDGEDRRTQEEWTNENNQPNTGGYAPPEKKSSNASVIVAAVMGILAIAFAISVLLVVLRNADIAKNEDDGNSKTTSTVATATKEYEPPVFTVAEGSSTRGTDYTSGSPVEYYPSFAIDGKMETAWSANREISVNPRFTLKADSPQHVKGIKMTNGYCKSENTYTKNRRITKVKVEYEGGEVIKDMSIDNYRTMIDIPFNAPVDTSYITIYVLDTYYGAWKDICISEIEVY